MIGANGLRFRPQLISVFVSENASSRRVLVDTSFDESYFVVSAVS